MVADPQLPKHLAHFGIDLMKMEKVCPSFLLFCLLLSVSYLISYFVCSYLFLISSLALSALICFLSHLLPCLLLSVSYLISCFVCSYLFLISSLALSALIHFLASIYCHFLEEAILANTVQERWNKVIFDLRGSQSLCHQLCLSF